MDKLFWEICTKYANEIIISENITVIQSIEIPVTTIIIKDVWKMGMNG